MRPHPDRDRGLLRRRSSLLAAGGYPLHWNVFPEDPRRGPGLARWLDKVFWVMGGYIIATGLLVCYLARTSFQARERSAWGAAALVGAMSVGLMTAVNFVLASDFRWPLLAFAMLWATSLVLFARGY